MESVIEASGQDGQAAPVTAQRFTASWNSNCETGGAGRLPGLQAHWTSASVVM